MDTLASSMEHQALRITEDTPAESAAAAPSARTGGAIEHERLTAHYGWVRAVARNLVRDPGARRT
jgi:hypothetical protein